MKNGSTSFGIGSTIVVIPYDPPGDGEIKALYLITSPCRFPSRWQPLSGIRRSRGSQFALRPIKTMSVSPRSPRARVRRPPCHSLTRFLSSQFRCWPPRVCLPCSFPSSSTTPSIHASACLVTRMSSLATCPSERPTGLSLSHLATSASVRLFLFFSVSSA